MADVNITPKISCDNCGAVEDKVFNTVYSKEFVKPRTWGSCRIEGTRSVDSYGGRERLDFTDLCPKCADAIISAAAVAAKAHRGEA